MTLLSLKRSTIAYITRIKYTNSTYIAQFTMWLLTLFNFKSSI